mmetsp:Transcript_89017/g.160550  ORF Transcript_89017/g.160550 Transcript_89017/m.160550 type:complete len:99 (-) Transcript_89017:728-1024(-)
MFKKDVNFYSRGPVRCHFLEKSCCDGASRVNNHNNKNKKNSNNHRQPRQRSSEQTATAVQDKFQRLPTLIHNQTNHQGSLCIQSYRWVQPVSLDTRLH